ncbi:MAG: ferrous iron transport protein B, partial [Synergistaceae bacterium]|nr:ferrous iron transport protein B [Synergistaceae bacterium]MBP9958113.1 ferrous iron transport protein B [Synergistaceae bacterium]
MSQAKVVALVGNPNTGKTSIFNALTGMRQHVGNWPGVTVERKEGTLVFGESEITIVDLPGIYSLGAASVDEQVAADFILREKPELVVTVADASNLERSLYLAVQLREMGLPILLVLNMHDVAQKKGIRIDDKVLESVLGCRVLFASARIGVGMEELKACIAEIFLREEVPFSVSHQMLKIPYGEAVASVLSRLTDLLQEPAKKMGLTPELAAIRIAEGDAPLLAQVHSAGLLSAISKTLDEGNQTLEARLGYDLQTAVIERRWAYLSGLTAEVITRDLSLAERLSISDKIDRLATHRILGLPLFLLAAWVMFRLTYLIADPILHLIEKLIAVLGHWAGASLSYLGAPEMVRSFVVDGMISGVGSVVVFFPHIFMLFLFIAVLEDSGYLSRGAFVMDRIMHSLGLHGKSFIPMLMGFGCNVPAMMGTRVLDQPRDRMITLMVLPFMTCSARLPVLALFAATFFPRHAGTVLFLCYAGGVAAAVFSAKLLGATLFKGESSHLIMELPPYRIPTPKIVFFSAWERGSLFLQKMGTFIFFAVTLIWAGASFPFGVAYASPESYIGHLGKLIAPLFSPMGFGTPVAALALLFGVAAKEIVLSTFGTLLKVGDEGLAAAITPLFSPAAAAAFITMTLLYVP